MRVDEPTLSIVAMRRRLVSFSGTKVSMTFQRPFELVDICDELEDFRGS